MGSDDRATVEASNPIIGSFKVSSANLNTLFTVLGFILTCLIAYVLYNHGNETKDASKELAQALREQTQAAREQTCIISLPQERREQNSELCKRIAR